MTFKKVRSKISKTKKISIKYYIFAFLVLLVISILLYIIYSSKYFNFGDKLGVIAPDNAGNAVIMIFDSHIGEIVVIKIPADLELNVSRNLGIWKVRSLWELGKQEKLGGVILAETATRSLELPVYAYGNIQISGLASDNVSLKLRALIFPGTTNLGAGDRLKLFIFSVRTRSRDKEFIDLADYSYLKKTTLTDGGQGHVLFGEPPTKVTSYFNEEKLVLNKVIVEIIDKTDAGVIAKSISKSVENLGGKVVSVTNKDPEDIDCIIRSGDKAVAEILSRYLSCHSVFDTQIDKASATIEIGTKYQKRY